MFGGIPRPAVGDGERTTDGRGKGVDIAVGVIIVDFGFTGFLKNFRGGSEVTLFEIKDTGAEFELFVAVVVDNVDDRVGDGKIFKLVEGVGEDDFVAFFVGSENGGAEIGHFDVVETKKGGRNKK